ncbi:hypothetical protein OIDMADRAFT_100832 [Oidiodendron maius Zn]|uniref:Uncharacterized protein n=1 Tax=Oidiodendron maius (strain Zn) TaxID=913774 RepID=A0A0C3HCE5_OIDMZ|nr:hypothetical protein OIDMADRAFT_100832 [Oidiodendron maius Zn]
MRRISGVTIGSEIFFVVSLLIISAGVLLLERFYLPLRTTPAYLLVPIFFALGLPASIILLVPIDLASSSGDHDVDGRGIWLPRRLLLVSWRISYWLTFALTWFILPILAEYADAGYREPKSRLMFSLRANLQYHAIVFGAGIIAGIYIFITSGVSLESLESTVMALAYSWGLVLAIYLMGHGLVAIPRRLFRNASVSGRLKRIQTHAAKVHEKMEDAIMKLEDLEAQVEELSRRNTGSAKDFKDWIEELTDDLHLPESQPRTLTRRLSEPQVQLPAVITEKYLADLSRQVTRARHNRARYVDEWDRLLYDAVATQAILDSSASKRIEIGQTSPYASFLERFTILTPYTRYLYKYYLFPYTRILLGSFLSLASMCIVWSELVKTVNPIFSIISVTVIHHAENDRGQIGIAGQVIAACWILYMCAAALSSLTEVKVWRGRALVRRNTHGESAMWYAMQVAKLSVPLAFNFLTFFPEHITKPTVFDDFIGRHIKATAAGEWFDLLFPVFILVPVCATLFNLYGKIKGWFGFGGVIDDEEEGEDASYGTGSWREGRGLIERELQGHSEAQQPPEVEPEDEGFFDSFSHRVRNTIETAQTPKWFKNVGEGFKRPKWMGGGDPSNSSGGGSNITSWFAGRQQDGRVRL